MGLFGAPDIAKLKAKRDVGGLIRRLADKDPTQRQMAVEALGDIGGDLAVGSLLAVLGDPVGKVQAEAATALGKMGGPRMVQPLIGALKGSDARTNLVAQVRQLGDVPNAKEVIADLLGQEDCARKGAAFALGLIGDPQAVEPLIDAVAGEFSWTAIVAAQALGMIGDARAAKPLGKALGKGRRDLREQAVKALVKIGAPSVPVLVAALKNSNAEVRMAAIEGLDQLGCKPAPTPEMAEALIAGGKWSEVFELGSMSIEPLIATMMNSKAGLGSRYNALDYLGYLFHRIKQGQERCIQALVTALDDPELGWKALVALGETRSPLAVEPVLAEYHRAKFERRWRVMALSNLHDPRCVKDLVACMNSRGEASPAAEGIRMTLLNSASGIADADLRAITKIKDLMKSVMGYIPAESMGEESGWGVVGEEVAASFSEIRKLASEELTRRGLKA